MIIYRETYWIVRFSEDAGGEIKSARYDTEEEGREHFNLWKEKWPNAQLIRIHHMIDESVVKDLP